MVYAAWMRRFLGDDKACFQLGAEVVAIGQEYGYVFWTTLGSAYIARGTPGGEAHREFLQETVATLRLMGQEAFAASNLGYLAELHAAAGHADRAQEVVAEALDVGAQIRRTGPSSGVVASACGVHARRRRRHRRGGRGLERGRARCDRAGRPCCPTPCRARARPPAGVSSAERLAHHARGSEIGPACFFCER